MPFLIVEGPEAVGKDTFIQLVADRWMTIPQATVVHRHWGPQKTWEAYRDPLYEDLAYLTREPWKLIIWNRGWVSRFVYNTLLQQGLPYSRTGTADFERAVYQQGGSLVLMEADPEVLRQRRAARLAAGDTSDHQLDPAAEMECFQHFLRLSRGRIWTRVKGDSEEPDYLKRKAEQIVSDLLMRGLR